MCVYKLESERVRERQREKMELQRNLVLALLSLKEDDDYYETKKIILLRKTELHLSG